MIILEDFLQFFLNGLVQGSELAIVTMGFAIVVNTVSIWHIAHAGTYVVGAYLAWVMVALLGLPLYLGAIIAIVGCGAMGIIIEFGVYRPLRRSGSPIGGYLIASIGLAFVIQNACALLAGTYPKIIGQEMKVSYHIQNIYFTNFDLILIIACALVFVIFHLFLNRTSIGLTIKAIASNPLLAEVWGANFDMVSIIVIVVASLTVAPAALLRILDIGIVPFAGWDVLILALFAYIVGGVGSTLGAGFAGLCLGIIKNLMVWQMPSVWSPLIIFSIVYLFMWVRPRGMLGKKVWVHEV